MDKQITEIVNAAIANKIFPGAVVGYIKDGKRTVLPFGKFTYDETSPKVTQQSMYDVASITKSIPTSCLAIKFIGEEKCSLDDTVKMYLPRLAGRYKDRITIRHLLTQTLEFPFSLSSLADKSADEILDIVVTTDLVTPPGEKYVYTNTTSVLLGLVIEEVGGKRLDVLADEYFFTPLHMRSTTFHQEKFQKGNIAPTEIGVKGEVIQGFVHDESARKLSQAFVVGSAGLFSTVPDLLVFLQMLLQRGAYQGVTYFSEQQVQEMGTNQLASMNAGSGLGWEVNQSWYKGKLITSHTFSKTGFTGCVFVGDVERKRGFVLLSNYNYPKRKKNNSERNILFREICSSVFS